MSAPRRRRGIGIALLALGLAILLGWLAWPRPEPAPRLGPSSSGFLDPEVLRLDAGGADPSAPFTVDFDSAGHLLALAFDAGVAEEEGTRGGPRIRHDVAFDSCEEPLPEDVVAPEGTVSVAHEGVVVAHDGSLSRDEAMEIARAAREALDEAAEWVGAPARERLLVITHPTREELNESLGGPGWALGLYDGAVHVVVDGYEGSLRHEVMHAQLHAASPCVPFWLDEGLASRFEHRPFRRSLSWLRMIHAHVWIPFPSVAEPLGDDEGAELMERDEVALLYAQCLAMVAMLDERGGEDAIARAVAASRDGTPRRALWDLVMMDAGGEELLSYLASRLFPSIPIEGREGLRGRSYVCRAGETDGLPRCEPAR